MSKTIIFNFIFLYTICQYADGYSTNPRKPPHFSGFPSIKEIANSVGFESSDVEIMTEDGYSLWIHRIGNNSGPPVLLQHGYSTSAEIWMIKANRHKDLAFVLVDAGYDVWLLNQRGNIYNEYSLKYNKSNPRFWDFSFHEAGYYDVPAAIDRVLKIRGQKHVFFIGYSLGATLFLVMASCRPEYNSKVRASMLLFPNAKQIKNAKLSFLNRLILNTAELTATISILSGRYTANERSQFNKMLMDYFCNGESQPRQNFCLDITGQIFGDHRSNIDKKLFGKYVSLILGETSHKTKVHIAQLVRTGEFKQFDYGPRMNKRKYNNTKPPFYRLELVTTPIAIYWSYNDPVVTTKAIQGLVAALPNVIYNKAVPDPHFSHADVIFGENSRNVLFPEVLKVINSFNTN